MNFNEYQELSKRTMPNKGFEKDVSNYCMGLAGETGEVVDLLKKVVHHGHPLTLEIVNKVYFELGDVLHYVSGISTLMGFDLEVVAERNIKKLEERFPNGFSTERSINREG